jgi:hypothetical protein
MAVILPTLAQTSWRQGVEPMLLTSVEVRFDRRATKDVALSRIELISLRDEPFPDGHFKFPHLWPLKLPQAGRSDYGFPDPV